MDYSLRTGITCIHGDIKYYPTTQVTLSHQRLNHEMRIGVVPRLPHRVILKRDFPGFKHLVNIKRELDEPPPELETQLGSPEGLVALLPFFKHELPQVTNTPKTKKTRQERRLARERGPPVEAVLVGNQGKHALKGS